MAHIDFKNKMKNALDEGKFEETKTKAKGPKVYKTVAAILQGVANGEIPVADASKLLQMTETEKKVIKKIVSTPSRGC